MKGNARNPIRFWQAYINVTQFTFEGRGVVVEVPVGDVHAVRGNFPLCRVNLDSVERNLKANGHKTYSTRPSIRLCEKCKEEIKGSPELSNWIRWEGGMSVSGGETPEVKKHGLGNS